MISSSGIMTLMEQVQELLTRYAEVVTDGLPPRELRLCHDSNIEWRNVKPDTEDDDGPEGETIVEVHFIQVREVPPGSSEERIKEVYSHISLDDILFNLTYNALVGTWMFSYYPQTEMGLEVRGAKLELVLLYVVDLIERRIAFSMGDVDVCTRDLDKELLELVGFKDDESPWF